MTRHTLVGLNPVELNHYRFMINIDKDNGSCNAADDSFMKICVLSHETKRT